MMSLIWKYYADPVTVLPSKWLFSSRANGGLPIWLCANVVRLGR
uniref:Uncharacterized protein n=1 Tax=Salmo trutta TaxID=8032 RepID=A0A673ZAY6_SALTR